MNTDNRVEYFSRCCYEIRAWQKTRGFSDEDFFVILCSALSLLAVDKSDDEEELAKNYEKYKMVVWEGMKNSFLALKGKKQ